VENLSEKREAPWRESAVERERRGERAPWRESAVESIAPESCLLGEQISR
jgi:hypothetical protein